MSIFKPLLSNWRRPRSSTIVNSCTWSKTSKDLIAVITSDSTVSIINKLGSVVDTIQLPSLCLLTKWCYRSNILAILVHDSNQVIFWNELQNSHFSINAGFKENATLISWSKSGYILAIGTCKGSLALYDYASKNIISITTKHLKCITDGCWSQENYLFLGSEDCTITISDLEGKTLKTLSTKSTPSQIKCIKESPLVSTIIGKRSLYLYDLSDPNNPIELSFRKQYGSIVTYKWFKKTHCLIGLSNGVLIEIAYDDHSVKELVKIVNSKRKLVCLRVSKDDDKVAVFDGDAVKICKMLQLHNELLSLCIADCTQLKWSVDGQMLAVCRKSGHLPIFYLNTQNKWTFWENQLAILTNLTNISIFDTADCKKLSKLNFSNEVTCFTFNNNHLIVATNSSIEVYKMLNYLNVELITTVKITDTVNDLQINQDYVSIMSNGQIILEKISDLLEGPLTNQMTHSDITCQKLAHDCLCYGTNEGFVTYYCISEKEISYQYRHTCSICRLLLEPFGTHSIVLDSNNQIYIIDAINDDLIKVPYEGSIVTAILWETEVANKNIFIVFNETSLLIYSYNKCNQQKRGYYSVEHVITITQFLSSSQSPLILFKDTITIFDWNSSDNLIMKPIKYFNFNDKNYKEQFENYLKLGKYSEAERMCENDDFWNRLVKVIIDNMELELARGICTKQKMWPLRKLVDKLSETETVGEYCAEVAIFEQRYDAAEAYYLENDQVMRVIEMRKGLGEWDVALSLAQSHGFDNEVVLITKKYAYQLELKKKYSEAVNYYKKSNQKFDADVTKGMARCSLYSGNYQLGYSLAMKSNDKDLMEECGEILEQRNQLNESANLFEKCNNANKLAPVLLKLGEFTKLDCILDTITVRNVFLQYAKVKEEQKKFEEAVKLYLKAEDYDNVIRIQLTELNNPDIAVGLIKDRRSVTGAEIAANYFIELNDYSSAVQCLLIVGKFDSAYQLAGKQIDRLEMFGKILVEMQNLKITKVDLRYFEMLANDLEQLENYILAANYYKLVEKWDKALSALIESSKVAKLENESLTMAIEMIKSLSDNTLINRLKCYLKTKSKDDTRFLKYLINFYVALKDFNEIPQIGLELSISEQLQGNYKVAHKLMFDMYLMLDEHKVEINEDFDKQFTILHSYIVARVHIQRDNHDFAARLLLRVVDYLDQFPSHTVAILTSVCIECYRTGRKREAFAFASQLMKSEYRKSIDEKFVKKIEAIVRRSAPFSSNEDEKNLIKCGTECQSCGFIQNFMNMNCDNCKKRLPLCIVTGHALDKSNYTSCPKCLFYANYLEYIAIVRDLKICPMCSQSVDLSTIEALNKDSLSLDRNLNRKFSV